jgi:hypothetical protein
VLGGMGVAVGGPGVVEGVSLRVLGDSGRWRRGRGGARATRATRARDVEERAVAVAAAVDVRLPYAYEMRTLAYKMRLPMPIR